MMKAHEVYRKRQYEDAITDAASAFESSLKTICSNKGWAYNPDKDTLSRLVKACGDNDLFPPFYVPIFEAVGTVRNEMSDAHGRGPKPLYKVGKEHADHTIQMTSAHITFVVKLAGLLGPSSLRVFELTWDLDHLAVVAARGRPFRPLVEVDPDEVVRGAWADRSFWSLTIRITSIG